MKQDRNSGFHWTAANDATSAEANVNSVAVSPVHPGVAHVATWVYGVLKTIDGGDHWISANEGLPPAPLALSIAIETTDPDHLLVGLDTGGVYRSKDGGAIWTSSVAGLNPQSSMGDNGIVFTLTPHVRTATRNTQAIPPPRRSLTDTRTPPESHSRPDGSGHLRKRSSGKLRGDRACVRLRSTRACGRSSLNEKTRTRRRLACGLVCHSHRATRGRTRAIPPRDEHSECVQDLRVRHGRPVGRDGRRIRAFSGGLQEIDAGDGRGYAERPEAGVFRNLRIR